MAVQQYSMDRIDRQISQAESNAMKQQNSTLLKQNQLLKQELAQLKTRHSQTQKQLTVYKDIVLKNSSDNEVLQMQHQRIFELETQLETVQTKYSKMVKSGGSNQMTEHAQKCKQYERRIKDMELDYQKQINTLKNKLAMQSATQLVEAKRLITSPNGQVKKSSLAIGKFV